MAFLITPEGVVQQADPSRCIGCRNGVYACPFGVPKIDLQARLMNKCNLCYDRTAQDLQRWCAQACPTQAMWYGDYEGFTNRPNGHPVDGTVFGDPEMRTRVYHVLPAETNRLDVSASLDEARADLGRAPRAGERQEAWVV